MRWSRLGVVQAQVNAAGISVLTVDVDLEVGFRQLREAVALPEIKMYQLTACTKTIGKALKTEACAEIEPRQLCTGGQAAPVS